VSVLDCFLVDDITKIGCCPLYDVDKNKPVFFATPTGDIGQIVPHLSNVQVPMFFMPMQTLEECAAKLLVKAALARRKKVHFGIRDAARAFDRGHGLIFHRLVTHKDHRFIPEGLSIAVAEPEYTGRHVIDGQNRGLLIFNSGAVIGYQPGKNLR
jgi:hypothetical protein